MPEDLDLAMLTGVFEARPDREDALTALLARYVVLTRHEPGCRNVDLVVSATQRGRFLVIEKWESAALLRAHLDSELMVQMAQDAVPLLAGKPVLDLYDTISAHDLA
jgi:quinol monooxygenase YgiN